MQRPTQTEYPDYFLTYLHKIPAEGNLLDLLASVQEESQAYLRALSPDKTQFRYAEGKWSVRELVQHLIDCERVMAYRALRFMRGDSTELAGFEEDDYVAAAATAVAYIDWAQLLEEWAVVRKSNIALFRNMREEDGLRSGTANGKAVSVRALAAIILGHEIHHIQILKERYFPK